MSGAIYLCGGDFRSGPRDACPHVLHDYPLPSGYVDASEAAGRRLSKRWHQARCPDCGLYGWRPGNPTGDPCDERVPPRQPGQVPPDHPDAGKPVAWGEGQTIR